jgi:hypothetical protein
VLTAVGVSSFILFVELLTDSAIQSCFAFLSFMNVASGAETVFKCVPSYYFGVTLNSAVGQLVRELVHYGRVHWMVLDQPHLYLLPYVWPRQLLDQEF